MALPCTFIGATTTIWGGDTGATDIPAHIDVENRVIYTCWRYSPEELAEIVKHGQSWIRIHGSLPPMHVTGIDPFCHDVDAENQEEIRRLQHRSEKLSVVEAEIRNLHPTFFEGDNVVAALLRRLRAES